jgi:hypothetical protein
LTRWVDWFTPGQLQTQILNETDRAKAPDHPEKLKFFFEILIVYMKKLKKK